MLKWDSDTGKKYIVSSHTPSGEPKIWEFSKSCDGLHAVYFYGHSGHRDGGNDHKKEREKTQLGFSLVIFANRAKKVPIL